MFVHTDFNNNHYVAEQHGFYLIIFSQIIDSFFQILQQPKCILLKYKLLRHFQFIRYLKKKNISHKSVSK